jgi:acyl carrier protein
MSIEERVLSVLRENLENGEELAITSGSELSRDLHVDSLDALTIVYCLENEFSVALHDSALSDCRTVRDVISSLEKALPPGDHNGTNQASR